jgi:Tfp pilus assembly protein PilE
MTSRGEQRSFLNLLFEVVLIAVGVFLALWANNWHENSEHRAQARAALRNFAAEMETNRQATQRNRAYHETLARELEQFLRSKEPPSEERLNKEVHFEGVRPVIFEHTAWDLALATQALSYLKPELAFDISKVYTQQNAFQTLENSFLASAFTPASIYRDAGAKANAQLTVLSDNPKGMATAIVLYLIDVNQHEPAILQLYDKVIPEVNSALSH